MTVSELLPCPFCGAHEVSAFQENTSEAWIVSCDQCIGAGPPENARSEAIAAWNRRTPPAQAAEAVERAMDVADTIMNRLEGWDRAYPTDIFREVTDAESKWLHETRPGLIDRISAGMGRHMAGCIREDLATLRAAIAAIQAGE